MSEKEEFFPGACSGDTGLLPNSRGWGGFKGHEPGSDKGDAGLNCQVGIVYVCERVKSVVMNTCLVSLFSLLGEDIQK